MELNEKYWSDRYLNNEAGWDIGKPSTPLAAYIDQMKDRSIAILIPGGGNSYEAEYLLAKGFTNITVADISAVVCKGLKEKFASDLTKKIKIIHIDFFELEEKFDLILEQTFFCALDPELRKKYASRMYSFLNFGGKIVGVLFNREFEDGPPFSGNVEEYEKLFKNDFDIQIMEPCYNSIKPREGTEVFIKLVKK